MNAIFDMGGYELYVWGSMALAVVVFAWNVLAPAMQHRSVMQRLAEADESEEGT